MEFTPDSGEFLTNPSVVLILQPMRHPASGSIKVTMTESFAPRICPFCGQATTVPHETQARCIEALRDEIRRTRLVLNGAGLPEARPLPDEDAPRS